MAQPLTYQDVQPVNARSYRKSSVPTVEQSPFQPEALEIEPGDFEADYVEDRSVPALAERRRQALAKTDRAFVDMDLP